MKEQTAPTANDSKRVFAIYANPEDAERGVKRLLAASFAEERIRVVVYDDHGPERVPISRRTLLPLGALSGLALGAAAGGVAAALGAVAPVAGVLGGAMLLSLGGALTGLMFWRYSISVAHEEEADEPGVLVVVPALSEARSTQARDVFEESGGEVLAA